MKTSRLGSFFVLALLSPHLASCIGPEAPPAAPSGTPPTVSAAAITTESFGPILLQTSQGPLEITFLTEGCARLRFKKSGETRVLESFALDPAWKAPLPPVAVHSEGSTTRVRAKQMTLLVEDNPLMVSQLDVEGRVILQQSGKELWAKAGPSLNFSLDEGERVFGLGDKAKGHDRRGHHFEMWNTDAFGWKVDQDPLYKSFPVFVFVDEGNAHGVFVDSPTRALVDVGKTQSDRLSYDIAQGDFVDIYLLSGPDPKMVIESYTELTGRLPLPPYWSLGFHMSRYGYMSEQEVRDVVGRFRSSKIPLDTIWLDIDFQQENAPFTVNRQAFPHFRDMIADFKKDGVHTVAITDLHLKSYQGKQSPSGYLPYDQGAQGDHFLRHEGKFYEGKVWPGLAVFPEFTLSRARDYWGSLYEPFLNDGIAGFWNDMNEPAIFEVRSKTIKEDQQHRLDDGSTIDHRVVHNAFGALNVRATYEGVQKLRPNERPFTLTRAAYSGAQRYSASWTGDNSANREHLAATIPNLTNLGVSGYPYVGADVGGFDGCPDAELLVEWMELGAFQPFYRNHSGKGTCMREPWVHGPEFEARTRKAIERRYQFLPFIYTIFEEATRTGMPIMRPLWLEYPGDENVAENAELFLVGRDLLVAAQLKKDTKNLQVELPRSGFYDIETGELHENGGKVEVTLPKNDSLRLFARAGAIIAQSPPVQHTGEVPQGALVLEVFPGADCGGQLYLDDGKTLSFREGELRRIKYSCSIDEKRIKIVAISEGEFPAWWNSISLVVHGINGPASIRVGDASLVSMKLNLARKTAQTDIANDGSSFTASVEW